MDDDQDRPTSRGWYLVSFGLIGTAIAVSLTGWSQMREVVSSLQRHPMPGSAEVALADGRAILYYEHESRFDNRDYATPPDLAFHCTVTNLQGKPLALRPVTVESSYAAGPYVGRNVFDLDIVAPGSYTLTCDGPQPFVVAVGGGIGAWKLVSIVGGIVPGLPGLIVAVIVTIKRRRWRAEQALG